MKWTLLFLFTVAVSAQEPTFRTGAREVIVPVSVMTKDGKPVEGLNADDFVVLDDGKPEAVRMISRDSTPLPIYAVIVLQVDEGSEAALAKIRKTASVISTYISNDMDIGVPSLAAVITVADEVKVARDFTADPDLLRDTFGALSARGSSNRVIDGVNLACDLLAARNQAARRVVVVISGSRDGQSKARFSDVVVKAQKHDIVIYTISYSAFTTAFTEKASDRAAPADEPGLYDPSGQQGMNLLAIPMLLAQLAKTNIADAFAQSTGGSHQKFTTLHGLEKQLMSMGTEIHNRYVLTFVPGQSQRAGYHELSVSVRKAGDWRIHARTGYWSAPK